MDRVHPFVRIRNKNFKSSNLVESSPLSNRNYPDFDPAVLVHTQTHGGDKQLVC